MFQPVGVFLFKLFNNDGFASDGLVDSLVGEVEEEWLGLILFDEFNGLGTFAIGEEFALRSVG